ncbi:MAG: GNAT family N-acetyltransferase [Frankiaceae bacterium]
MARPTSEAAQAPALGGRSLALIGATAGGIAPERIISVAALTRAAYSGSDPFACLPAPDGAEDDAASVSQFLAEGGTVWMAVDASGEPMAALRCERIEDGAWFVSRIAVVPGSRGRGLGRRLVAAVERALAADGVRSVQLDAVVERCLPAYYAQLGYRAATHHLATDDKLLTEIRMERDPATARHAMPPFPLRTTDDAVNGAVCWFLAAGRLSAVARIGRQSVASAVAGSLRSAPDDTARLAGVDLWRGEADELGDVLRDMPGAAPDPHGTAVSFDGGRHDIVAHVMPRTYHQDLWAAIRPLPQSEPDPRELTTQRTER